SACGTTSPTKPTRPASATAAPVRRAAAPMTAIVVRSGSTPSVAAVSSPKTNASLRRPRTIPGPPPAPATTGALPRTPVRRTPGHVRVREAIAEQPLKERARDRERASDERRRDDPRQPEVADDDAGDRIALAEQGADDVARRERHRADEDPRGEAHREQQREDRDRRRGAHLPEQLGVDELRVLLRRLAETWTGTAEEGEPGIHVSVLHRAERGPARTTRDRLDRRPVQRVAQDDDVGVGAVDVLAP